MALSLAIDKEELYEVVWPGVPLGEYEPCSPVPPGLYYRTEEGLTCIQYDPEKALQLLDESGWVDTDGDGIRDKDGVKLSLLHCTTGAGYRVASATISPASSATWVSSSSTRLHRRPSSPAGTRPARIPSAT